jgi:hypothetical protein
VTRPDFLKRAEWTLAALLSVTALFLLVVRATHAGPLWRDECAVVNLARMPSLADIARNFEHEAFPVPFPILVRGYTNVVGTSDAALRSFGIAAGVALLGALWFSSHLIGRGPPLVSLGLLGLNTTFLFWGTTVRGYGLGSALIVLAFGLLVSVMFNPSPRRIIAAALISIAAVQCLVHNLALIFALAASAAIVCLVRRDLRQLIIFLSILALCLISFIPYLNAYSNSWSQVVEFPLTFRLLWNQFNFALGNPNPALAWFWHIVLIALLAPSIWQLHRLRVNKPVPDGNLLLFGSLAAMVAPIAYYEFLQTLSYLTRSWYFLALLSVLAVAMDCLAVVLSSIKWIRIGRLAFAGVAIIILPINAWPKIVERQTNIDIVAKKVTELARPADLIVVAPWQYGISFSRYYHGVTPWITLPTMVDLRVHRYDLFREKMLSPHPIDDVLDKVQQTLSAGNRVWFVGGIKLPPEGRAPRSLPPLPNISVGWDNVVYSESWLEQLGAFVRTHSEHGQTVSLTSGAVINNFEDVPLVVADGWQ